MPPAGWKLDRVLDSVIAGILSGGGSRRFGSDKAFALWQGKTLLERTIERASHLTDSIYILAKDASKYELLGYPVITDSFPVSTPLNGILSISPYVEGWLLLLACDIPFFDVRVLDLLWENRDPSRAAVIHVSGKYQPFLGLYPKSVLRYWEDAFIEGDYHLQRVIERMPRLVFTEDDLVEQGFLLSSFSNINTVSDLEQVASWT